MATEYTIASINIPSGTVVVYLTSSDGTLGAEIPSNTIVSLGEITERLDLVPGVTELENVTIGVTEDYNGTPTQGFWAYVTAQTVCDLRLTLAGNTIFVGSVLLEGVQFDEAYVSGNTHVRTGAITFVSQLYKLKNIAWTDLFTSLYNNSESAPLNGYSFDVQISVNGRMPLGTNPAIYQSAFFIKLADVFACMVSEAFDQSFSSADVTVENCDIDFQNQNQGGWWILSDVYVVTQYVGGGAGVLNAAYFKDGTSSTLNLNDIYPSPYEFMIDVLKNLGLVARHGFDGSRHTITLGTRGQSSVGTVTISDAPLYSIATSRRDAKPAGIRFIHEYDGQLYECYVLDGQLQSVTTHKILPITTTTDEEAGTAPSRWASFDYEVRCPYFAGDAGSYYDDALTSSVIYHHNLFLYDETRSLNIETNYPGLVQGAMMRVDKVRYYNYQAGFDYDANDLQAAMVAYVTQRFTGSRRVYERRYSGIKDFNVFTRHNIDDGSGAVTFYATEVRKDLDNDETTVVWVEE